MFKKLLKSLDVFLPQENRESIEAPVLYRARMIIVANLISIIICFQITLLFIKLSYSLFVILCLIGIMAIFFFLLLRLRYSNQCLVQQMRMGAFFQIFSVAILIYVSAFNEKGIGFFALFWLTPVFLNIAFYFNNRDSIKVAFLNLIILIGVMIYEYPKILFPVYQNPNFSLIFVSFIIGVITVTYAQAILFVHLSEELQVEIVKQRDLLIESAKFQTLGKMASNLAHDINNPLFTIQGKLHQIRNLLSRDQLDLEKCDQIVESAEQTIIKLSQIVKGISTFARQGRGDQMVSIKISDLIEGNMAMAIDRIKKIGIDLELDIKADIDIICYPSFISQVLLNLLNNAIDAIENSETKKILVKAYTQDEWVVMEVIDSGPGITPGDEEKIFEQFYTTKKLGKGTGLGLSISKGLVEVHEGEIHYSRIDDLTVFRVLIPLHS